MIKPLTSLRFIFALMIFGHHISFVTNGNSPIFGWLYTKVLWQGNIGVSFFFLLSGFILAYTYQKRILSRTIKLKHFFLARVARIYPLHILTLLLSLPLALEHFTNSTSRNILILLSNVTLTQSLIPIDDFYFSINSVAWSISNEMTFYTLFPLLIFGISYLLNKKLGIALIIPLILMPFLIFIIPETDKYWFFYINPFFRIFDFIIGIILYNLFLKINLSKLKVNFTLMECCSLLALVVFFLFYNKVPEELRYSIYYWIPMSFIILAFSFKNGALSKLLSNKFLIKLGEISFGFYMVHQLILKYILKYNTTYFNIENNYVLVIGIFTISLLVSMLSYRFFELPINKYLKKVFIKK